MSLTAAVTEEGAAEPCDHESSCALEQADVHKVSSAVSCTATAQVPTRTEYEQCAEVDRVDGGRDIPQVLAAEEAQGAGADWIDAPSPPAPPPGLVDNAILFPFVAAVPAAVVLPVDNDHLVSDQNRSNGKGTGKGIGKGKGKGANGGFRNIVVGANAARDAMDSGLQTALEGLPADLRRRMEGFAVDRVAGRRVKLPWQLKAKQRKAVHLWAEMHGLEHKSFGYRGRRRLHLTVPGSHGAEDDSAEADFDWAAWEGEEEEWDADE